MNIYLSFFILCTSSIVHSCSEVIRFFGGGGNERFITFCISNSFLNYLSNGHSRSFLPFTSTQGIFMLSLPSIPHPSSLFSTAYSTPFSLSIPLTIVRLIVEELSTFKKLMMLRRNS